MLRCGYKRFCVAIGHTEMWTDMRLIQHYASNKIDFTRRNFNLDSASSILKICWLSLRNPSKLVVSNSQNPPPDSRGVHLNSCNSPARNFAIIQRSALCCNNQSWCKLYSFLPTFSNFFPITPPSGLSSSFLNDWNFSKGASFSNNFGNEDHAKSRLQIQA